MKIVSHLAIYAFIFLLWSSDVIFVFEMTDENVNATHATTV